MGKALASPYQSKLRGLALGRQTLKKLHTQKPRKTRKDKGRRGRYPKRMVRKAILDCYGNRKVLTERLGCAYSTVRDMLNRVGWEDVRELFDEETERLKDLAEDAIVKSMQSTTDIRTATWNARWLLERKGKDRGYGKEETINVQGGDRPVQHQHHVLLETLDLPLDVRRTVLAALESKETEGEDSP